MIISGKRALTAFQRKTDKATTLAGKTVLHNRRLLFLKEVTYCRGIHYLKGDLIQLIARAVFVDDEGLSSRH